VTIETPAQDALERDCFAPRSFCPYNADMAISASSRSQVRLLGVPWDANSSFLRGPALAPGKVREALQCDASNSWSETGIDTAVRDIFGDAGDVRPDTPSKRKRGVADDAQGPCDSNCESASAISE